MPVESRRTAHHSILEVVPTADHFDVVVIGGGPGGYAAALYGASAGLNMALVEKRWIGGTCLNVGCIPAKELLETAHVYRTVQEAASFGINAGEPQVDWSVTMQRKQAVVDELVSGVTTLLEGRKVTIYHGHGRLHAGRRVTISGGESGDLEVGGDAVIIAAGSEVRTIPGFDIDGNIVMTSDEVLSIPEVPGTAVIVGGGAIGCEFASMLSDMGSQVTVLEVLPKILPGVDKDAAQVVERSFKKRGIEVRTGVKVTGHEPSDGGTVVNVEGGDPIKTDVVVVSVGRKPATADLGLDGTGVQIDDRGFVVVDELCRTGEQRVWSIGDCIDTPQLAHVGFAEAIVAITDILGEPAVPIDYGRVPWGIYCQPEVAFAGHTEESAKEAGFDVVASKHRYSANSRAKIIGDKEGLVKIIAAKGPDGRAGQILGVHMVGPWVTEQLGQGYLAVNWEATIDEVAQFIQPHPTLSEAFGDTVLDMTGRRLH
ncbi:MAG TPA: dihydrolipoyl dehydrogenase [Acidimicrobiales bacterium]|nr:dihydrolipoyl dehydrogenase [Acidimicrobiales bacterium]